MEKIDKSELFLLSPLALAYVGDSVHTLFVRENVVRKNTQKINDYNKQCSFFCKAQTQSKVLDNIIEMLTDDEKEIVRKARNTKIHHNAKNASVVDYKKATCFEALVGYLYLCQDEQRLNEILNLSIKKEGI